MESWLSLLISIALILLLIKRLHVGYAILAGAGFLAMSTLGGESLRLVFSTLLSHSTLRLMLILFSVLSLSYTMERAGMLTGISSAVSQAGGKFALIALPAIIGLLPMPGGALVSAMMISGIVKSKSIGVERASFTNYWLRHLWVPAWPLYPAFIITLGVVEIDTLELVKINLPITLAALLAGLLLGHPYLDFGSQGRVREASLALAKNAWPIAAVILLALVAGLDLAIAMPAVLALTLAYTRPSQGGLKEIAKKAINPRWAVLIYAVMLFRNGIEASGSAEALLELFSSLGMPVIAVAPLLSFIIGFAVGIEMAPPSIALPLFISFVGKGSGVVPEHLLLIFAAGYIGVQLSPMHLCFTATAGYFETSITRLYRYTLLASALSFALVLGYIAL